MGILRSIFQRQRPASGVNLRESRAAATQGRLVRAGYDAAKTTDANQAHWGQVDSLSANAANSLSVRKVLRERARYESANSCYCYGILRALCNDVIGTGPRVNVETRNEAWNAFIESEIRWWMREVRFARKLRTCRLSQARDGEGFQVQVTNENLSTPVKLDVRVIECDQFSDPSLQSWADAWNIDGKRINNDGNPVSYRILTYHPGDSVLVNPFSFQDIPAAQVAHLFREDRPGQQRGIPEIMPALPLFAQMRRYTLAVLDAAEAAADFAMFIYTDATPDDLPAVTPMDTVSLERGMATTLPQGYKAGQMKPEQPSTMYSEFKGEVICECSRSVLMPYLIAAGSAKDFTYSGGRLDKQSYDEAKTINRQEIEDDLIRPLVQRWWDEAILIKDYIPVGARTIRRLPITCHWDQTSAIDQLKEDEAAFTRLRSGRSNIPRELAMQGQDWREEFARGAEALGISFEEYQAMVRAAIFQGPPRPMSMAGDDEAGEKPKAALPGKARDADEEE